MSYHIRFKQLRILKIWCRKSIVVKPESPGSSMPYYSHSVSMYYVLCLVFNSVALHGLPSRC
jgi:hypothetical protein